MHKTITDCIYSWLCCQYHHSLQIAIMPYHRTYTLASIWCLYMCVKPCVIAHKAVITCLLVVETEFFLKFPLIMCMMS